jgi:hypothetical protein
MQKTAYFLTVTLLFLSIKNNLYRYRETSTDTYRYRYRTSSDTGVKNFVCVKDSDKASTVDSIF